MASGEDFNVSLNSTVGPYGNDVGAMIQEIETTAANVVSGTNPVYTSADFLAAFPQFGGASISLTGTVTVGSNQLTLASVTGIIGGMLIGDTTHNIPESTIVTSIDNTHKIITMSNNATISGDVAIVFYSPVIPTVVLISFVEMANNCVLQARYHSIWPTAIGLFIAHFTALFLQSSVPAGSATGKIVAAAQSRGLLTSKSAGDISASYDHNSIAQDLDGWATYKLTVYGQMFATFAKQISKAGMYIW